MSRNEFGLKWPPVLELTISFYLSVTSFAKNRVVLSLASKRCDLFSVENSSFEVSDWISRVIYCPALNLGYSTVWSVNGPTKKGWRWDLRWFLTLRVTLYLILTALTVISLPFFRNVSTNVIILYSAYKR